MRRVHLLLAAALVFTLVSCSSLSQMMHSGAEAPMWYPGGRNIRGTVCFVAYGSGGSPLVSRDAAYNDLLDRISEYLGYDVAGRYYRELSSNQSIAELSLEIDSTFTSTSMDGVHYHYIMAYAEQPVIDSMRSRQRVVQARMEDEVDRLVESSLQYYRDNNDVEAINELLKAVTISSTYGIGGEGRSPQDLLEKAMGYLENIEIRLSAEHPERAEVTVRVVRDRGLLSPSVVNAPVEATFTVHTHDDRFETFSVPFVTGQDGRFTFEEYYPLMTQSGTVYFSLDIEDGIDAVARVTGEGFVEEMRAAGVPIVDEDPDIVVLTFDTTITYRKINDAYHFLTSGAELIATHPDDLCPTEDSYDIDIGPFIRMLEQMCQTSAVVIGKPNRLMLEMAARELRVDPADTVMVGDRLYTDIEMAVRAGTQSILVLSGETDMSMVESWGKSPTAIVESVAEIPRMLDES